MGCDIIKRACAIQMLVICFGLHNSASLSVPSSSVMKSSSGSGGHQLALTRNRRYRRRAYADYSDDVQNYLMNFGYLPKTDIETGNLRSESQLIEAIKTLQTIGNIPVTGEINDETKRLMTRPRCGVPDTEYAIDFYADNPYRKNRNRAKRFAVLGRKWEKTDLTWSLQGPVNVNHSVGTVRRVLSEALNVWAKNSKLTFREVSGDDADLLVSFVRRNHGDGHPFEGPGGVLAHAFYPGPGIGGDAHFDDEETWLIDKDDNSGTNLMGAAVHEFGHSLGLGHSSVQDSIMFPWYQSWDQNQELPEDDRLGIQQIYGATSRQWGRNPYRPRETPQRQPPSTATTSTTTTTTTPAPKRTFPTKIYYPERHVPDPRDDRWRDHKHNPNHPNHRHHYNHPFHTPKHERYNPDRKRVYTERPTFTNSVDNSPTRSPPSPRIRPNTDEDYDGKPDQCNMAYDAVSIIRGQLFIFKNKYLWRFTDSGQLMPGYPSEIRQHWRDLPEDLTHIDSVYENKEMQIVFFIGKSIYVFNTDRLEPGYPRPLTDLGLSPSVDRLDAVLVWSHNNRTYFYSGNLYWRFDEDTKKVELDYPRDMSMWGGIGYNIGSAFQWKDHRTYFFKGKGFWKFDDHYMQVGHEQPRSSAHFWMKCPKRHGEEHDRYDKESRREKIVSATDSAIPTAALHKYLLICLALITISVDSSPILYF